jgi:DNA-directed RNA polymerase specialized sigma24 family protein
VDRSTAGDHMLSAAEARGLRGITETQLTEEEATALLMRTFDRLTPAEIAEAMGWSGRRYRKVLERAGGASSTLD